MVDEGKNFDEIEKTLSGEYALGFNASMIINNQIMRKDRNEKSST